MIEFELRQAVRNNFRLETIEGVDKIIFSMTVVVGVVGNTYPSFLNSNNSVEVICNKSLTGVEMDAQIQSECAAFVAANFPSI
jgi:hypothetical protein